MQFPNILKLPSIKSSTKPIEGEGAAPNTPSPSKEQMAKDVEVIKERFPDKKKITDQPTKTDKNKSSLAAISPVRPVSIPNIDIASDYRSIQEQSLTNSRIIALLTSIDRNIKALLSLSSSNDTAGLSKRKSSDEDSDNDTSIFGDIFKRKNKPAGKGRKRTPKSLKRPRVSGRIGRLFRKIAPAIGLGKLFSPGSISEVPILEVPKVEAPKPEIPKIEVPKPILEVPKVEVPKPILEVPKVEAPKPEIPKVEVTKPEIPKPILEVPKLETPKPEIPKAFKIKLMPLEPIDIPIPKIPEIFPTSVAPIKPEVPKPILEVPKVETPKPEIPKVEVPKPTLEVPKVEPSRISKVFNGLKNSKSLQAAGNIGGQALSGLNKAVPIITIVEGGLGAIDTETIANDLGKREEDITSQDQAAAFVSNAFTALGPGMIDFATSFLPKNYQTNLSEPSRIGLTRGISEIFNSDIFKSASDYWGEKLSTLLLEPYDPKKFITSNTNNEKSPTINKPELTTQISPTTNNSILSAITSIITKPNPIISSITNQLTNTIAPAIAAPAIGSTNLLTNQISNQLISNSKPSNLLETKLPSFFELVKTEGLKSITPTLKSVSSIWDSIIDTSSRNIIEPIMNFSDTAKNIAKKVAEVPGTIIDKGLELIASIDFTGGLNKILDLFGNLGSLKNVLPPQIQALIGGDFETALFADVAAGKAIYPGLNQTSEKTVNLVEKTFGSVFKQKETTELTPSTPGFQLPTPQATEQPILPSATNKSTTNLENTIEQLNSTSQIKQNALDTIFTASTRRTAQSSQPIVIPTPAPNVVVNSDSKKQPINPNPYDYGSLRDIFRDFGHSFA